MKSLKKPAPIEGGFKAFLQSNAAYMESSNTVAYLGRMAQGNDVLLDMADAVHVLIAGATGSGKSVMMHSIIASLMQKNTPETARFLLIDPKRVEFFDYSSSDSLLGGRICESVEDATEALSAIVDKMNERYDIFKCEHCRNIESYQKLGHPMYRFYIAVDELSALMQEARKEIEPLLSKIGMLGRAAGIHMIVATQHPDRKTITGTIQSNIPTVIGLATRTKVDSRMIIQSDECTKLQGRGDAILVQGLEEIHFQGAYVSPEDIQEIVNNIDPMRKAFKKLMPYTDWFYQGKA